MDHNLTRSSFYDLVVQLPEAFLETKSQVRVGWTSGREG